MNFEIDEATRDRLEMIRERGRSEVRPIGLEADRLGRPIPVEDPYFARLIGRGEGRTRWPGPDTGEKNDAGRILRDAKLYEIGAGTNEIRQMLIGRELFRG